MRKRHVRGGMTLSDDLSAAAPYQLMPGARVQVLENWAPACASSSGNLHCFGSGGDAFLNCATLHGSQLL